MAKKPFTDRRWYQMPVVKVIKKGGTKEDEINGLNWALRMGIVDQSTYQKKMEEIEEKFSAK